MGHLLPDAESIDQRAQSSGLALPAHDFGRERGFVLPLQSAEALALACQHDHSEVLKLLLDAGEDPSRYNPVGFHAHSTPLHQAAFAGHFDVVRMLVERGARLPDTIRNLIP